MLPEILFGLQFYVTRSGLVVGDGLIFGGWSVFADERVSQDSLHFGHGLTLDSSAIFDGRFGIRLLLFRGFGDDHLGHLDWEIELGVMGQGRNAIKILPLVVENSEGVDCRIGVGRRVCHCQSRRGRYTANCLQMI